MQALNNIDLLHHLRIAQLRHGYPAPLRSLLIPAQRTDLLAKVLMPFLTDTRHITPLLAELLGRHPHVGQGIGQIRQIALLQEFDVEAQVAHPVDGLAIE